MPVRLEDMVVDDVRKSFDRDPRNYLEGRPDYPIELFDWLGELGAVRSGNRALEWGPGAGQASAALLARGLSVDAVELGEGLAKEAAARFADLPFHVEVGDVEHSNPDPGAYDLVLAANTFHWLNPEVVVPKAARALGDAGWLCILWTVFADPSRPTPFRERVDQIFMETFGPRRDRDSTPRALREDERAGELTASGYFNEPEVKVVRWTHELTAQGARELFETFPRIAYLPEAARANLLNEIEDAVTEAGGVVDDPYISIGYAARRAGSR
jgi:hypothetical protein